MRVVRSVLSFAVALLALSTLSFAVQPDRIAGPIDSGQMITLRGNVHGLARPDLDLGRADNSKLMSGVSLAFRPSATQQSALNKLLVQQQDPTSPNYHKWLTPAQFADRFGMTQSDVNKVVSWLQSQGFTVTWIASSRNQLFFQGTVAQIEAAFHTEIHNYLVDGEVHYANATEPSIPAVLAGTALGLQHLHNFQPKPRANVRTLSAANPYFTSHVSGNHFLTPGDFATIYDVQALYTAGFDGTGQKIAVTGQSAISLTDVANFRSAAGLAANAPTLTLMPGTGASSFCPGDEGESDLDVEFSGGIAKNANITLVYPGLLPGDTCGNRSFGAFDALQFAVDNNVAPVISNSYGNCEANLGSSNALIIQGWAQQASTQGQTIVSASGDSGAADCDFRVTSATLGFAVDIPAAIPEVTGAGGTEFNGDVAGTLTGTPPNTDAAATTYWGGTTSSTDNISSALSYIPETGWNDSAFEIANGGVIEASGGGKSTFFSKPSWQTGTGVPNDGQRDVPDISVSSSAHQDGYLFCTSDSGAVTCTNGFRDSQGALAVVGGTSAAAPTLAGVLALVSQYLVTNNFQTTAGLGEINPTLYHFAQFNPTGLNDVKTGNNVVPCTKGTTSCPTTGTAQYGFNAGTGYDQVTGLGSINGHALAIAWGELLTASATSVSPSATPIFTGQGETLTVTVTPVSATGSVSFFNNGGTTAIGTAAVSAGNAVFTTSSLPTGTDSITAAYNGNFASSNSSAVTVNVVVPDFTLTPDVTTSNTTQGGTAGPVNITVTSGNGFVVTSGGTSTTALALTYKCTGLPAESTCTFGPSATTTSAAVTLNIKTTAPQAQMRFPLSRLDKTFYATMLLPGLLGIFVTSGSRRHVLRGLRLLGLIAFLAFSTVWLTGCGGSSNNNVTKDPGTPKGSYPVTVTATTGGVSHATQITLTVN